MLYLNLFAGTGFLGLRSSVETPLLSAAHCLLWSVPFWCDCSTTKISTSQVVLVATINSWKLLSIFSFCETQAQSDGTSPVRVFAADKIHSRANWKLKWKWLSLVPHTLHIPKSSWIAGITWHALLSK